MRIKKLLSNIELNGKNETFYKVFDKNVFSGEELQILRYFNDKTLESYVSDKSEVDAKLSSEREKPLVSEKENEISISYDLPILLRNVLVYRFLKFHEFESIYFDGFKPKKTYDDVAYFNTKSKDEQAEIIEILRTLNLDSIFDLLMNIEEPKMEEADKKPDNKNDEEEDVLIRLSKLGQKDSISKSTISVFCHSYYDSEKLNSLFEQLSILSD